jgi:predicted nucleotidyltransferase/DNA-binding transcriptional ArsR family regulator
MLKRLDEFLGTPTKVAIFRLLCRNRNWFTGRDIARRVGKGVANVHRALDELDAAGAVEVQVKPPVKLFRLAESVPLVKRGLIPLFNAEAKVDEDLWDSLAKAAGDDLVSMILFGSRARGDSKPGSDVDVLFVLRRALAARRIRDVLIEANGSHDARLQPLYETLRDLPSLARRSPELWQNIIAEGVVVRGSGLREVQRHARASVARAS